MKYPHPLNKKYDDAHFLSLIRERENTIAICKIHNIKKRRQSGKKEKTMKQMIMELDGDELDTYLREQGFSLNKCKNQSS